MEFKERKLKGVFEITLNPIQDHRGFFMRSYDVKEFEAHGINRDWKQENHSKSVDTGVVRGLHFQLPPHAETKMIRCIAGAVWDVFVDLRLDSPTFGQWDAIELTPENGKEVYIPRGFGHGFCTLKPNSEVVYKVDNFYNKEAERGILWSDRDINIEWPLSGVKPTLSDKDKNNLTLAQFVDQYKGIEL